MWPGPALYSQKGRLCHLLLSDSFSTQLQSGAALHVGMQQHAFEKGAVQRFVAHCMSGPAEDEDGGKRKLEDAAIEAAKRPRTDGQSPFLPGSTHRCLFVSGVAKPAAH